MRGVQTWGPGAGRPVAAALGSWGSVDAALEEWHEFWYEVGFSVGGDGNRPQPVELPGARTSCPSWSSLPSAPRELQAHGRCPYTVTLEQCLQPRTKARPDGGRESPRVTTSTFFHLSSSWRKPGLFLVSTGLHTQA